jgi:hypothetical protein
MNLNHSAMKKKLITLILIFIVSFCAKAQLTTINLNLDTPCASLVLNTFVEQNEFIIYPNPSNGIINISGDLKKTDNSGITIHDLKGSVVYKLSLSQINTVLPKNAINVNHLQSGIYLFSYTIGSRKITKKLIINKQ